MSKRAEQDAVLDQDVAEPEETKVDQPDSAEPVIVDGVLQAKDYLFGAYQEGGTQRDEMSIDHLFAKAFNPAPYHFVWIRYNRLAEAKSRYFIPVSKQMHGKWFAPNAFHKTHPGIVCGEKYMDGGKPEFYLHVRSAEAKRQEDLQMLAKSRRQVDIENRDEFKAVVSGIGRDLGSSNVSGGVKRVGGWGI